MKALAAMALLALGQTLALLALGQAPELDVVATLERWRESLALDLPKEVLAEGTPLVAPGAALEHDGRAVALVARALFAARLDGTAAASQLLERCAPTEGVVDVELEKVRVALESDDLARALIALLPTPQAQVPRFAERAESWLYAGRAWTRSGEAARGAPFLAKFVELAPRDAEAASALHALVQEALARGDGATAQRCLRRAQQLSEWHALWRVRVLQVRERPDAPLPRLGLAQLWLQAGDGERAKAVLVELVRRSPDYAPAWFHLGEAERLRGALDPASEAYSKTLTLDAEHLLARNNRATIARMRGRLADARADFEHIVDGDHATEELARGAHLALARVLDELGLPDEAARRYARYVALGGGEPRRPH